MDKIPDWTVLHHETFVMPWSARIVTREWSMNRTGLAIRLQEESIPGSLNGPLHWTYYYILNWLGKLLAKKFIVKHNRIPIWFYKKVGKLLVVDS